jgi:hypothetical protein
MASLAQITSGIVTKFPYGYKKVPVALTGTADVLVANKTYDAFITTAAIDAMTLPLPKAGQYGIVPGLQANVTESGGDDDEILIVATTAFAHTLTTPANGLNKTLHIATFAAAVGNYIRLKAFNGTWYVLDSKGITLS